MQDFSKHPDYFDALESFPETDDYENGTRLDLGDYDSQRNNDKFKLRGFWRFSAADRDDLRRCLSVEEQ